MEERRVARQPFAAVVVGEEDERVAGQAQLLQHAGDPSDALVGALDHRHVVGPRARVLLVRLHEPRVSRRDRRLVGHLERPVRGVVGDLEEERTLRVLLNEADRPLGDQIGHVSVGVDRRAVFEEVVCAVRIGVLVIIDEPAQESEEVVEPVRVGLELRAIAEMPLAHQGRRVSGVLQELRQRLAGGWQSASAGGRRGQRRLEARALIVAPGHQHRAGRRARRRGVEVGEPDAVGRQPVDVRRPDVGSAVTSVVAVPDIVHDDEDDVRLLLSCVVLSCRRRCPDEGERRQECESLHAD